MVALNPCIKRWPNIQHVFKVAVKDGAQPGLIAKNLIYMYPTYFSNFSNLIAFFDFIALLENKDEYHGIL